MVGPRSYRASVPREGQEETQVEILAVACGSGTAVVRVFWAPVVRLLCQRRPRRSPASVLVAGCDIVHAPGMERLLECDLICGVEASLRRLHGGAQLGPFVHGATSGGIARRAKHVAHTRQSPARTTPSSNVTCPNSSPIPRSRVPRTTPTLPGSCSQASMRHGGLRLKEWGIVAGSGSSAL